MTKKAELSMNVIVMATIAVLVLVVMVFIFVRGVNTGNDGLLSCDSKGGVCETRSACQKQSNHLVSAWTCENDDKTITDTDKQIVCCIDKLKSFGIES